MRLNRPLLLSIGLFLMNGCAPIYHYHLEARSCLNPAKSDCDDDARDSRPLRIRIYHLSSCLDRGSIQWADLQEEGKDLEMYRGILIGQPRDLVMERNEYQNFSVELDHRAKCVIVATLGRQERDRSIVVSKPGLFKRESTFVLDRYEIFISDKNGNGEGKPR